MSIDALKDLARDTWKDIRVWATLQTLLGVHQKMIRRAQRDLETLAKLFSPGLGSHGLDSQVYTDILDELEEVERQFSDDLTRQGQSTCDMVCVDPCLSTYHTCCIPR
jgi:hypothetical protein